MTKTEFSGVCQTNCGEHPDTIKIFMSHPDWNEPGGPTSHLPVLIDEMKRRPNVTLRSFTYGFRSWGGLPRAMCDSLFGRLLILISDFIVFLVMCLRYGKPDILHLNSSYEKRALGRDLPYLFACRLLGIGCVIKTHGSEEAMMGPLSPFWTQVRRLHFYFAQTITFLSPIEAQQFRDCFPLHAGKFHVAKNIVIPASQKQGLSKRGKILFGGRFVDKKNIPNLIKGFAIVAHGDADAHLVMAGSGPLEEDLRQQARELGIEERITWTGWIDRKRLRALNEECQITAFTSTGSEGMPMILVESLNSNSTVVTTSVRWTQSYPISELGVIELLGSGPEEIADGLRLALNSPAIEQELIERRRAFLGSFAKEQVVDEFMQLYNLTIGRERRI